MVDALAHIASTSLVPPGHYGNAGAGVIIRQVEGLDLATVAAAPDTVAEGARSAFGVVLPERPTVVQGAGVGFVGLAPGRWLAFASCRGDIEALLTEALGAGAAVCDQSDGYLLFDITGPRVRDALAKAAAIDLDPTVFHPGDAATTSMAHAGVTFWQLDAEPTYRIAVGRSFAPSFLRFLVASAAEFGCRIEAPARG